MIHLLPTLAKVVERIILIRLTKCVELGDTPFGSRRRRGVHDAMATILEFIEHHRDWHTAMVSMDIEAGFDNININLLIQILHSRGADASICQWVNRWTRCWTVRFQFNRRLSKEFYTSK